MHRIFIIFIIAALSVGALPAGALRIAGAADFALVDSLTESVTIGPAVSRIPDYAFAECHSLTEVTFEPGSRCAAIGEGAFYQCRRLQAVDLPRSVGDIGRYAFAWCGELRSVRMPGVSRIRAHAFAYCEALAGVQFPSTLRAMGNNAFSRCRSIESVVLPAALKELESYAFSDCTSLRTATLPANGALLGELIFSGCDALTQIVEPSRRVPRFDCNSFLFEPDDTAAYERCRLIVPPAAAAAYRAAPGWKLFRNISDSQTH